MNGSVCMFPFRYTLQIPIEVFILLDCFLYLFGLFEFLFNFGILIGLIWQQIAYARDEYNAQKRQGRGIFGINKASLYNSKSWCNNNALSGKHVKKIWIEQCTHNDQRLAWPSLLATVATRYHHRFSHCG